MAETVVGMFALYQASSKPYRTVYMQIIIMPFQRI